MVLFMVMVPLSAPRPTGQSRSPLRGSRLRPVGNTATGGRSPHHTHFVGQTRPWQRATNENTNGLLRQYFPARKPIPVDQADLDEVAAQLNGRPRKTLGFMTPAERYTQLLTAGQDS
jgi:hypothetical protein